MHWQDPLPGQQTWVLIGYQYRNIGMNDLPPFVQALRRCYSSFARQLSAPGGEAQELNGSPHPRIRECTEP